MRFPATTASIASVLVIFYCSAALFPAKSIVFPRALPLFVLRFSHPILPFALLFLFCRFVFPLCLAFVDPPTGLPANNNDGVSSGFGICALSVYYIFLCFSVLVLLFLFFGCGCRSKVSPGLLFFFNGTGWHATARSIASRGARVILLIFFYGTAFSLVCFHMLHFRKVSCEYCQNMIAITSWPQLLLAVAAAVLPVATAGLPCHIFVISWSVSMTAKSSSRNIFARLL